MSKKEQIIMLKNMRNFLLNELPNIIERNKVEEPKVKQKVKVLTLNRKPYDFHN